jgi:hypothetical protein
MVSQETMQSIRNDWLKVGTMLIVSHLLSGGDLQNQEWMRGSLFTLLGFTVYHLVTAKFDTTFAGEYKPIADDWMKVGTMLVVSRVLAQQPLDEAWMRGSLFTLLGFTAYHVATKKFISTDSLTGTQKDVADDWLKAGTMMATKQLLEGKSLNDPQWQKGSLNTLIGFNTYDVVVKPTLERLQ